MWEDILTHGASHFIKLVGEEDDETVGRFFEDIQTYVDHKSVVVHTMIWQTYDEATQVKIAVDTIGEFHASRYLALMDYLYLKLVRSEDDSMIMKRLSKGEDGK